MNALRRLVALDEALLMHVSRLHRPVATRFMRAITHLGDGASLTFLGIVMFAVRTEATNRLGVLLTGSTVLATIVAQVLKRWLKRSRPTAGIRGFNALVANPDAFSFPSGHTAAATALAVAWAHEGSWLGMVAGIFAALVGSSRVYLGAHYPLDVMVGALLGLLTGLVASCVV